MNYILEQYGKDDSDFVTTARVGSVLSNIQKTLKKNAPELMNTVSDVDIVNMLHKVYRPETCYKTLERAAESIILHNKYSEVQDEWVNTDALVRSSIPNLPYDHNSIKGALRKNKSMVNDRPEISLEY